MASLYSTWHENIETVLQGLGLTLIQEPAASKNLTGYMIEPNGFHSEDHDNVKLYRTQESFTVNIFHLLSSASRNKKLKEIGDLAMSLNQAFNSPSNWPVAPYQGKFELYDINMEYDKTQAKMIVLITCEGQYNCT